MSLTIRTSTVLRVAVALPILLVAAGRASPAHAQSCVKYTNNLSFCPTPGGLADPAWCTGASLNPISPQDETVLYSRLYADTPEEAMQEWGQYGYPDYYANQDD